MDAQKIQKLFRLSFTLALAIVLFNGCATDLLVRNDIKDIPDDLKIEIVTDPSVKIAKSKAKRKPQKSKIVPEKSYKTWKPNSWPFGMGEKITYRLRYGPIEGGIGTIEVKEPKIIQGKKAIHYHAEVKSSKVLNWIYKIDDTMDSWVDAKYHLPIRQEILLNESRKHGRRVVTFDWKKKQALYYSSTVKDGESSEVKRSVDLLHYPQDIFGAFFFMRFIDDRQRMNFPIYDRYKNWANELIFLEKERIKVLAGRFNTLKYKSNPRVHGDLETRGDVEVWFSDDARRLPIMFKAHIRIGAITGELKAYEPGIEMPLAKPSFITPYSLGERGELQSKLKVKASKGAVR